MAVIGHPLTEAQSNQIPPALRLFARNYCTGVEQIERYSDKTESIRRGWKIEAEGVELRSLPDGFEARDVMVSRSGNVRVYIREV